MAPSFNRPVLYITILLILFTAILLFSSSLLPFIDLPNHLAEAAIYKYRNDYNTPIGQYYTAVPAYYPNTFHTVFCSLFPSVEAGNKIFYVLYSLTLLLSMQMIIRSLGGNQWYGLLSVFFLFGYNVIYGFTGFTIAIPTILFLFYVILKDVQQERIAYKVVAAFLLVLLYLMHAQMALFGLMLYGVMMLFRHWGAWKKLFFNSVVVSLPVVLIVGTWWMNRAAAAQDDNDTLSFLASYYKSSYLPEFWLRFRLPIFDNYSLYSGITGYVVAALLSAVLFLPIIYFKAWKGLRKTKMLVTSALFYPVLFLVVSGGCYLFLPNRLPGQAPLYERFCTIVMLALIIVGSVLLKDIQAKGLRVFVMISAFVYMAMWSEYFISFNKENEAFRPELFSSVPMGSKVSGFMYDFNWRGRATYVHYPNYYLTWHQGIIASKIIDYRFGVVRRTPKGEAELPKYREWIGRMYKVEKAYDTTIHYFLVKGQSPVVPDSNLFNKTFIKGAGKWTLFSNNNLVPH